MHDQRGFCEAGCGDVYWWSVGSGPALLLLHQASQSSAETKAVAELLKNEFRVIGLDYPGHGFSGDPASEPDVADYAESALAVLDHLSIAQAHVCGHHSGGVLAMFLATKHASRVGRVVIAGVGMRYEETVQQVLKTPMTRDLPVDSAGDFLARTWDVYRRMSAPNVTPEKTFEFFREGLCARTRPYDAHFAFLRWDWNDAATSVTQQAMMLYGTHDHFVEDPHKLAERIDGCRVRTIDAGAFMFYEQPAECAREIAEFLKRG